MILRPFSGCFPASFQAFAPHEGQVAAVSPGFVQPLDRYCHISNDNSVGIGGGGPPKRLFTLQAAGATDPGLVREKNEDFFSFLPGKNLYLLADGMGGHNGGEVASRMAVDVVGNFYQPGSDWTAERRLDNLKATIDLASFKVHEAAEADTSLSGMGTTLVALHIDDQEGRYYTAHAGDSRIYLIRHGRIQQLTEDHTLVNSCRLMGTSEEKLRKLPKHIIVRSVGLEEAAEAEVSHGAVEVEDIFLLCSDGLTEILTDDEIRRVVVMHPDPQDAAKELVLQANEGGGPDNITVLVVRVNKSE